MKTNPPRFPGPSTSPNSALIPDVAYPGVPGYPVYVSPSETQPSRLWRYLAFLRRKWWIVLLSVLLFGGLAGTYITWWPPRYACLAYMWIAGGMSLQLRDGMILPEDNSTFAGTQIELLQSSLILGRAYNRVQQTRHITFPTNSEGKLILPKVSVAQRPKSAVLELRAKGPSPDVVITFLNAVMDEFLAYKKEVRLITSSDTYTSVSEQILKQEGALKVEQDKLTAYMRDNNVAVLEEQAKAASAYLTELLAEASQLKLEIQILEAMAAEGPLALVARTNSPGAVQDIRLLADRGLPSAAPPSEFLTAQQDLEKLKILRTRLSNHLRPEHPKIVILDQQISMGEKLVQYEAWLLEACPRPVATLVVGDVSRGNKPGSANGCVWSGICALDDAPSFQC